jgi:uncharacterized membrane protein YfcA
MASAAVLLLLQGILIVCASFISGLSGFGQAIIYQTVWTLLGTLGVEGAGDLKDGVAITFIGGVTSAIVMARESYRAKEVRWDLAVGLTPGSLVFTLLGTAALTTFNQAALKKSLGILFLLFASWQLYNKCKAIVAGKQAEKFAIIAEHELAHARRQEIAMARTRQEIAMVQMQQAEQSDQQESSGVLQEPQPLEHDAADLHLPTDSFLAHSPPHAPVECDVPRTRAGSEVEHFSNVDDEQKSGLSTASSIQLIEVAPNGIEAPLPAPSTNPLDDPLSHSPLVCSPALWLAQTRLLLAQREFQWALLAGSAAGFLGGCFGTNGPPIMLFFSVIPISKGEIRGTFAWNTIFLEVPKAITLLAFGIFRADQWPIYLLMPPLSIFGTWLGGLAHHQVDVNVVMMVLQGLILLSTVALCDAFDGSVFGDFMLAIYFAIAMVIGAFVLYSSSFMYRFLTAHPEFAPEYVRQQDMREQQKREADEAKQSGRAVVAYGPAGYTEWHA